ncbi:MAG: methyltransferase domain-containing protein [Actinomycetota bacterium]
MEDEWAPYASTWDSDPAARLYAQEAFGSLTALLDRTDLGLAGAEVLDFGAGTGLLTERLVDAGAAVVAVDTSAAMIEVLQAKIAERGWTGVTAGVDLPGPSLRFDLVACSSVCSFLEDYPGAARDLAGRLRPGGLFVQWDWEGAVDEEGETHGLTRAEISDALTGAGLGGVAVETGFSVDYEGETMAPLMGYGTRM